MLLVFFSLVFTYFDNKNFFRIIGVSFLSMVVLIYQSRANIALWGCFIILYIYFLKDFSFKKILELLFSFFIIPILLVFFFPALKSFILSNTLEIIQNEQHFLNDSFKSMGSLLNVDLDKVYQKKSILRDMRMDTSGRLGDWTNIFINYDYNKNLFFGYGSQGDRYLINQSASNGLIYAFVSSGIIGLIFYIIFCLMVFINLIKYLFYKRSKDRIFFSSLVILILLFLRSLIESSFAVFGVDFILVFTSGFIMNKKFNN